MSPTSAGKTLVISMALLHSALTNHTLEQQFCEQLRATGESVAVLASILRGSMCPVFPRTSAARRPGSLLRCIHIPDARQRLRLLGGDPTLVISNRSRLGDGDRVIWFLTTHWFAETHIHRMNGTLSQAGSGA